jgi:hypothetical protein
MRTRRSTLDNADANNASGRLAVLLDWLCKETATKEIIEKLTAKIDTTKMFPQNRARIVANTREEIAFAGYALMTNCKQHGFWRLCASHGVRGPHASSNVNEITRAGLQEYVHPFLDYVEEELISSASEVSVTVLIDKRLAAVVEQQIAAALPNTATKVRQIAAEFSRPEASWHNVGNSCRGALETAVRELVQQIGLRLPAEVEIGNVKRVAELVTKASPVSDSRGTLTKLIGAVWDHAQTVTHRDPTRREDAARLFIWTCLAIHELVSVARNPAIEPT